MRPVLLWIQLASLKASLGLSTEAEISPSCCSIYTFVSSCQFRCVVFGSRSKCVSKTNEFSSDEGFGYPADQFRRAVKAKKKKILF